MYQVIRGSENGNIGIKIDRKLTQDDYELLIPYIDRLRQKAGSVSLLCDMSECEGQASHTLWKDLVDQLHRLYEIPRVAVVTEDVEEIVPKIKMLSPLHKTSVKYFTPAQRELAWKWVEMSEI